MILRISDIQIRLFLGFLTFQPAIITLQLLSWLPFSFVFTESLMRKQKLIRLFSLATSLALVSSLVFAATVIADDSTPTPPVTAETTVVPPAEEPPAEVNTPAVSELLSEFPDNTALVLTTDTQIIPLPIESASSAVLMGDPIWCPEGVSPEPLVNGCTDSYSDLESLINDIDNSVIPEPSANGTIWIMAGADASTSDIVIDGFIFSTWSGFALTVQGGWDGSTAGNISGSSGFSVPISITNWGNSITLNQIIISNTTSTGLEVDTTGNIVLEDVSSNNNDGYGAELISSAGSITLNGANIFSGNLDSGLYAEANGDIQAKNLIANNNSGNGAEFYSIGNLAISGTNIFLNNTDSGLYAETDGNINTDNITANGNGGNGVELYSLGSVTLNGANTFTSNDYSGLYIEANNEIGIKNVTSDGNGASSIYGAGAELRTLGSVNVTGANIFINNYSEGLFISVDDDISLYNINASNNGSDGIFLSTYGNAAITCGVLANNTDYEIEANLAGMLTLNGVDFGGDIVNELGVDEDNLILNSNGCFTYPSPPKEKGNAGGNTITTLGNLPAAPALPINTVNGNAGQLVNLDCKTYQGTLIILANGDGVYIPCPIIDSAQIFEISQADLPHELPKDNTFVSGFLSTILENGEALGPMNVPGSIWYADPEQIQGPGVQAFYWNGFDWVEITDQITPFMNIFFAIPANLKNTELAILYWDGTQWVELSESIYLGNGNIIKTGGHTSNDGLNFEAIVNFTGTFVLVKK